MTNCLFRWFRIWLVWSVWCFYVYGTLCNFHFLSNNKLLFFFIWNNVVDKNNNPSRNVWDYLHVDSFLVVAWGALFFTIQYVGLWNLQYNKKIYLYVPLLCVVWEFLSDYIVVGDCWVGRWCLAWILQAIMMDWENHLVRITSWIGDHVGFFTWSSY